MSFWEKRKAAVAAEARAEQQALEAEQARATEEALAEKPDEVLLAEAGQPEPEALDTPEAVREFLNSALPQRLKTRALRRLWRLNPVLANIDGLVDYGEDFTDGATVVENLQTAYQVGKGMIAHLEALAEQAAPPEAEAEEAAPEADEPVLSVAQPDALVEVSPQEAAALPENEPAPEAPLRRRMTFTFQDTSAT